MSDSAADRIEVLATGFGLVESVRVAHGAVWFSDWTNGRIHRLDPASGEVTTVAEVASLPLCFDFAGDDKSELVVLDSRAGRLLRGPVGGPLTEWVDVSGLAAGAGNEVLVAGSTVYLNFGNFDPTKGFPTSPVGLLASVDADGGSRVLAHSLAFPNGIALTPSGSHLIVAESHTGRLSSLAIESGGSLGERHGWARVDGSAPDGISMAPDGACWFADVSTRSVTLVREGGAVVRHIPLDRGAYSCALDAAGGILYVAAAHWPGPARMFDPTFDWDGRIYAIPVGDSEG